MQLPLREHFRNLWPILALFTCFCLLYMSLIPPFEGPDGPEHIAYLAWLAEGNGFPPQGEIAWETPVRQEAGQPPLYYLAASLPLRLLRGVEPLAIYRPNPHFPSSAPGTVPDNKNVAIYYPSDRLAGEWLALYLARIVSLAFGWLLIASVYGLMQTVWPENRKTAVTAALFTAVTPQVIFISSIISNDVAAAATSSLTLWLLAAAIRHGFTWQRGLALGAAWGLALLSKSSSLVLTLPLAFGILAAHLQKGEKTWLMKMVTAVFWTGLGAFIIAGWWYARTWILYGSPLGVDVHCHAPWAYCGQPTLRPNAWAQWLEVFNSYWAAFGWGNIKFPGWAYLLPLGLTIAAAVGWLVGLQKKRWDSNGRFLFIHIGALALAFGGTAVALEVWMRQVTAPHGRLLFPALGAITCFLVIGWYWLWPRLLPIACGSMLLFSLAAVALFYPAYQPPAPLTTAARLTLDAPLNWQYGELAVLLSATPRQRSVAAGDTLSIQLCWHTLSQSQQEFTILIQLIGPENQVAASRRTYPGLGLNPTSTWPINQTFCDKIVVDIPATLAQTQRYQLEIGLIDQPTGERLPIWDGQGNPVNAAFVAGIRLEAAAAETAPDVTGTGPIHLIAYETSTTWRHNQPISLTLHWWLSQPVETDYTVFIHLRNPATGEQVLEADGPPLTGWYPTSWWAAPERVIDSHTFTLPPAVLPGDYDLFVGWYDPMTGIRLGEEIRLGPIEVLP